MGMIFRVLQVRKLRPRLLCAQCWRSFTHTTTLKPGSEPLHLRPGDSAGWVRDELPSVQPCLALLGAPGLLPPPASRVANAAVGHTLKPSLFPHQDAGHGLMSSERLVKCLPSCQLAQLLPWKSPERVGRLAARHPLPWDPPGQAAGPVPRAHTWLGTCSQRASLRTARGLPWEGQAMLGPSASVRARGAPLRGTGLFLPAHLPPPFC